MRGMGAIHKSHALTAVYITGTHGNVDQSTIWMFGTCVRHIPSEHGSQGRESVDFRKYSARGMAWRRHFLGGDATFLHGNAIAHPGLAETAGRPKWIWKYCKHEFAPEI